MITMTRMRMRIKKKTTTTLLNKFYVLRCIYVVLLISFTINIKYLHIIFIFIPILYTHNVQFMSCSTTKHPFSFPHPSIEQDSNI